MSYALELNEAFERAFARLDVEIQEVLLDDLELIAERADEVPSSSANALISSLELHRHEGVVDGAAFQILTWLEVDREMQIIRCAQLLERH